MKIHPDGTAAVDCDVNKDMTSNAKKILKVAEEVSDFTMVA